MEERMTGYHGRVALVTGGGTGIGRAIARELARRGAHVGVVYSRSEAEATATVSELRGLGVEAAAFRADVSDGQAVRRLADAALGRFGRLDVLVNSAGWTRQVPFADLDGLAEADWDRIFAVNVKGPWLLTRAVAAALRKAEGAVVNVSSGARARPAGSNLAYAASKAALIHLTACLAVALAPEVRVNGVAPGLCLTPLLRTVWSDEQVRALEARALLRRAVDLEDLARAAADLAGNRSITGETVFVDAGLRYA
jgi:3-oxoacyl-[acyl-carrier protein] reductase